MLAAGEHLAEDSNVKLQGVNRQLQATIDALRAELEREAASVTAAVQAGEARWADEVAQTQVTAVLR